MAMVVNCTFVHSLVTRVMPLEIAIARAYARRSRGDERAVRGLLLAPGAHDPMKAKTS
jgi:hypothetical protein